MFIKLLVFFVLVFALESSSPQKCGSNEVLLACGTACEPSCEVPSPPFCTEQCLMNVCQCADGFVRDKKINKCVKSENCSKK